MSARSKMLKIVLPIIVLLVPAVGMFCGVYFYAYKHRGGGEEPEEERWER